MAIETNYNPQELESKWQTIWLKSNLYHWDENEARDKSFVLDAPPPTVSGLLHMGHMFSYTQADIIARFKRMAGYNVFYSIGFDDNGLATERLVEKLRDIKAGQIPREEFRKLCQEVIAESEEEFRILFKEIALSIDWRQEYRTISDEVIKISQLSFLDLYNKNLVELRLAPTFWDVVDQTAIAQAEIEDLEKSGVMNEIAFKVEGAQDIVIATTRPELIPACRAIFYNPMDERFKHLRGKKAITPIWKEEIPILEDEDVLMDKGTGIVMCCTFGDIQDITWWRKYNLTIKQVIDLKGRFINTGFLDGLSVKEARAKILEELKELNVLNNQIEIKQNVKCAERSKAPLEIIPTSQWYIKILDKKEELLQKGNECKWHPEYMKVRYDNWVKGLNQDWCISRQRYFGVPFPVWYSKRKGEEGKILLATIDQLPCEPTQTCPQGYTQAEVTPATDVMDTWATSALTPQINAHGVTTENCINMDRFKKLYPADLRTQAHEIIRTWAFYTIAKSHLHNDSIPWKELMISGWCLAADKTKMSKSKGNVVTPRELIKTKGTDVVRYWAATSKLGVDIIYNEELFKNGHRLINKLWNASKFCSLHITDKSTSYALDDYQKGMIFEDADVWILSKLYKVIETSTLCFEQYEYADARSIIEEFFWKDLCDNYLEIIKVRLYNTASINAESRQSAIYTLIHVFKALYRLFAPFIPHVVEELNELLFGEDSVHKRGSWPKLTQHLYKQEVIDQTEKMIVILQCIHKYKSQENISVRAELEKIEYSGAELSISLQTDLKNVSNSKMLAQVADIGNPSFEQENIKVFIERKINA